MTLLDLHKGQKATILGINKSCPVEIFQRLLDLGFVHGATIIIHSISPLNDPIAYSIFNTIISLRKQDAKYIEIQTKN
ncbi:FeoA family protein [Myroides sp. LJL115]